MSDEGSVSGWLGQLKGGDQDAAQKLWQRYFRRLVGLAREHLRDTPRRAADEEDVALGAFASFCKGVEEGRFPRLDDRDDLWRLLVAITERKVTDQVRRALRLKRGGGRVRTEADLSPDGPDDELAKLDGIPSAEPTPDSAVDFAEE